MILLYVFFLLSIIIMILCLVGGAIPFGDRSGILLLQSISKTHFRSCMLRSGKRYQPVSEISEVTKLLKAWMEETHKQELIKAWEGATLLCTIFMWY